MTRIARATEPLYQTRDRPVYWEWDVENEDGSPANLTGATVQVTLKSLLSVEPLAVAPLGASGKIVATGTRGQSSTLEADDSNRLILSIIDSQGIPVDIVWVVIGEDP